MKSIVWLITPLVLLIVLVILFIPKNMVDYQNSAITKQCDCFGAAFWYQSKCIGFTYNCETIKPVDTSCEKLSCDTFIETLLMKNENTSTVNNYALNSDILIIMDVSNSMLGEKLVAAKNAGKSLINNVRKEDRVGIITFSNTASIISDFSNDTINLTKAIENISVQGGTKYLPALLLAEQLFANSSQENTVKGIIFLSDGVPNEKPERILEKSSYLTKLNITLFTISFGIENDNILQEMTTNDKNIINRRYKSYNTTESITEAFVEAYQELTTINAISITPDFSEQEFTLNELNNIRFNSQINQTILTSVPSSHQCVQGLTTTLHAITSNSSTNISLEPDNEGFSVPSKSLLPGSYIFHVESRIIIDDDQQCTFYGENTFYPIEIIDYNPCQPASCEEVEKLLQNADYTHTHPVRYPRKNQSAYVAILVDRSQSMENYIDEAINYAKLVDNMLYKEDYRSLTYFSDSSELQTSFTNSKISENIMTVPTQGTTLFLSAIKKIRNMYSTIDGRKSAIIISDGQFYDEEGPSAILNSVEDLNTENICLTIIGVGHKLLNNNTFIKELGEAASHNGCGGYIHTPSEKEIMTILSKIYAGSNTQTGKLFIDTRILDEDILAWLASSSTGVLLPLRTKDACVEPSSIKITIISDNKIIVQEEITANYQGTFKYPIVELPPGKYLIKFDTQLSNCTVESYQRELIILGKGNSSSKNLSILIILLTIGILVTIYEFFKN